jgi:hypothetical protein
MAVFENERILLLDLGGSGGVWVRAVVSLLCTLSFSQYQHLPELFYSVIGAVMTFSWNI